MKYIILGATGYIGDAFASYCRINEIPHRLVSRSEVDYSRCDNEFYEWLAAYVEHNDPVTVINCAGYIGKPNVDACELNKESTLYGNVVLPQYLSELCDRLCIKFAHISSGCIYSGSESFTEDHEPNFSFDTGGSFYSGTKALAERAVSTNPNAWQFRLRIPFDNMKSSRNYITKLLTYDKLIDVENSVSHRGDFVKACMQLMRRLAPFGIYNVTNPGTITTKSVVNLIEGYLESNRQFNFFTDYDSFNSSVKTGRSNCTLCTDKLTSYVDMRSAESALIDSIVNYR